MSKEMKILTNTRGEFYVSNSPFDHETKCHFELGDAEKELEYYISLEASDKKAKAQEEIDSFMYMEEPQPHWTNYEDECHPFDIG